MFLYLRVKTTEAWKQEWMWRIMSRKPLALPEMCAVLELLDTTMWKVSTAVDVLSRDAENFSPLALLLLESCLPTFLQISRPEFPVIEK